MPGTYTPPFSLPSAAMPVVLDATGFIAALSPEHKAHVALPAPFVRNTATLVLRPDGSLLTTDSSALPGGLLG
jgi:hypothetical protein